MANDANKPIMITDPYEDRYASLHLINWWDQEKVKAAHVMVVGAGALGNEVLKNLALLGVGHLVVVDFDKIEASNLTRSVLFRASDGGESKALVAAQRVREINAEIDVIALQSDVRSEVGTGVYQRMDVVIGCLDNRAARLAVNQACWNTGKPWIDGALDSVNGLVRAFGPPTGACYECTFEEEDYALLDLRYSCEPGFKVVVGREPTLPTTAAIIAAMQVQEAMKLLHGLPVSTGRAIYYSWQSLRLTEMAYSPRPDCPAHTVYQPLVSLPIGGKESNLSQFTAIVRFSIKDDGILFLPQEIVTWLYCSSCKSQEMIYQPYSIVFPERQNCPICGKSRAFDVTSTLSIAHPIEGVTLAQLGIPLLHILPVRTRSGWFYFELSADEKHIFHAEVRKAR